MEPADGPAGGMIAMLKGPSGMGSGGLLLWPLFGATNQLLAGLAFMVITFYLWRRNKPIGFVLIPMIFMIVLPGWALIWQLFNAQSGWWYSSDKYLVATIGTITLILQLWMVVEAMLIWPKAKGILETPLPPLSEQDTRLKDSGGRSC
eukprot:COSAG01_NODE_3182_length_6451_cov_2.598394_7_plen_148_part_00